MSASVHRVPRTRERQEGNSKRASGTDEVSRHVSRRTLWRTESQGCQWGEIDPRGSRRSKPLGGCENLEAERTGRGKPGVVDSSS